MENPDKTLFARNLKWLRGLEKISQAKLAPKIGVSKSDINNWEQGKGTPGVEDGVKVAQYFSVAPGDLFRVDLEIAAGERRNSIVKEDPGGYKKANDHPPDWQQMFFTVLQEMREDRKELRQIANAAQEAAQAASRAATDAAKAISSSESLREEMNLVREDLGYEMQTRYGLQMLVVEHIAQARGVAVEIVEGERRMKIAEGAGLLSKKDIDLLKDTFGTG